MSRVDIKAILANPAQRTRLLKGATEFIIAVERGEREKGSSVKFTEKQKSQVVQQAQRIIAKSPGADHYNRLPEDERAKVWKAAVEKVLEQKARRKAARPTYQKAIEFIAESDDVNEARGNANDGYLGRSFVDGLAGFVVCHMAADLFGKEPDEVARDVEAYLQKREKWVCAECGEPSPVANPEPGTRCGCGNETFEQRSA
jgi:hypothetical protein